ncbi:hypothetical protein J2Y69_001104 [Microbacterium resistens]|uniref:Hemerythrin-like domain-containing protein n=1 Tax=Microbacterium resistens TaxID=156977 RepID=A0ABU1SAB4_9MICO|nr:hemerythrin domain-containing protein [Microbacterium resistens]MDR6866511.1 hypothetical protein [Microbacterium resistens]
METTRIVAWARELREVHARLRAALRVTQEALLAGDSGAGAGASSGVGTGAGTDSGADASMRDLLLYCHGFCTALDGHHRAEDGRLFPALEAAHPDLAPTLRALEQDHSMIAHLLGGLRGAVDRVAGPEELGRHVEGVAAIMESHFRYEERMLLEVLGTLDLDASAEEALGSF